MSKYRIYERYHLVSGTFYEVHQRFLLFWWRPVKVWYQPEIVDMPGWFTTSVFSLDEARRVIKSLKDGYDPSILVTPRQLVHEE